MAAEKNRQQHGVDNEFARPHRMHEEYDASFRAYLAVTDEKEVLLQEIVKRIDSHNIQSVLDIGAGNGDLAIPVARKVDRYCAVEAKASFAATLRDAGLYVIEDAFPVELDEQFGLVLASHAIPYKSERYEPFLQHAWRMVQPGGLLLGITYDNEKSEWSDFLDRTGLRNPARSGRLTQLVQFLETFAPVVQEKVVIHVRSKKLEKILAALAFVYSDGKAERIKEFYREQEALKSCLDAYYKTGDEYAFPFCHIFVSAVKSS